MASECGKRKSGTDVMWTCFSLVLYSFPMLLGKVLYQGQYATPALGTAGSVEQTLRGGRLCRKHGVPAENSHPFAFTKITIRSDQSSGRDASAPTRSTWCFSTTELGNWSSMRPGLKAALNSHIPMRRLHSNVRQHLNADLAQCGVTNRRSTGVWATPSTANGAIKGLHRSLSKR